MFWENIREIWPRGESGAVHSLQGEFGEIIQGKELSEHINQYFANIGTVLADKIKSDSVHTSSLLLYTVLNKKRDDVLGIPITLREMSEIVNNVDANK